MHGITVNVQNSKEPEVNLLHLERRGSLSIWSGIVNWSNHFKTQCSNSIPRYAYPRDILAHIYQEICKESRHATAFSKTENT